MGIHFSPSHWVLDLAQDCKFVASLQYFGLGLPRKRTEIKISISRTIHKDFHLPDVILRRDELAHGTAEY